MILSPAPYEPTRRVRGLILMVDTNCINAKQRDPPLNQIDEWKRNGVISVEMAQASYDEARAGRSQARTRKTMTHIYAMPLPRNPDEGELLRRIESILFPGGCKDDNARNDVEIVFTAKKYNAVLVTRDGGSRSQPGGILGNRDRLLAECCAKVVTPEEAVELVRDKIRNRDDLARHASERSGKPIPKWVGRD